MGVDAALWAHRGRMIAVAALVPPLACWLLSLFSDAVVKTAVILGVDSVLFNPGARSGLPCITDDGMLLRDGRTIDIVRRGLPTDIGIVLPIRCGGRVYGHFLLTASTRVFRPRQEQLKVAALLADQVGAALAGIAAHRDA